MCGVDTAASLGPTGPSALLALGSPLSTADYLQAWLGHTKGRVRARTWQGYESLVRCHAAPGLGEIQLSELRPLHLQALYDSD